MTDSQPQSPFASLVPQRSVGLKLLLVCGLALLMAIPALFIHSVVQDRRMGADRALADVSEMVGGQQSVLGPVLSVPYSRTLGPRHNELVYGYVVAYADTGTASADVDVQMRTRGIHAIPVFDATISMDAVFDPAALRAALPDDATIIGWAKALLGF